MPSARPLLTPIFATAAAVSCSSSGGSYDCSDVCGQLKSCIDTTIDHQLCSDRCFDRVDDDDELRANFDSCSSCLDDENLACADVPTICSACTPLADQLSQPRE